MSDADTGAAQAHAAPANGGRGNGDGSAGRAVGFLSLLALGINGIVGVGIFFAPSEVASLAPGHEVVRPFGLPFTLPVAPSTAIFTLTALAMVPVAVALGRLGSRFDEDGGPVLYARAAFGEPAAYVVGWLAYVTSVFSCAAIHVGLVRAVTESLGYGGLWVQRIAGVALLLVLSAICAAGIRVSAGVWSGLAVLKVIPLILLVGASLVLVAPAVPTPPPGEPSWLRAALRVTFTYQGFEIIPVIAGQVRGHRRSIPVAVLGSLLCAALLYVGLQSACVRAVPDLAHAALPLAAAGEAFGGRGLAVLLGVGTSVSALGIAFGMVAMTPRFLSALARVSELGLGLADETPRGAPLRALFVTIILVAILVALGDLGELFTLSSIAVVSVIHI